MEITISYAEALEQHPEVVKRWAKDAGSEKYSLDPKTLKWSYYFGVAVKGMDGHEFVRKLGSGELFQEKKKLDEKTPEQIADETISNIVGLSFKATGTGFNREKSLKETPNIFIKKYKEIIIASENQKMKDRERLDALTPQERQREEQEILNELFGMGGFFGVNVGPQGISPIFPKPVQYNVDEILDKVSRVGLDKLSPGEKRFLEEHSKKM